MVIQHDVPFMMPLNTAPVAGCREVADLLCDKAVELQGHYKRDTPVCEVDELNIERDTETLNSWYVYVKGSSFNVK